MNTYLELVPDDTEFHDRAAQLDQQRDAQRKLERDPDYIAQQRGLQALARGDLAGADPLLARAARARPDDADALGGLGLLRLREGTWPGHVMEHVALELQTLAGMKTGFGKARSTSERCPACRAPIVGTSTTRRPAIRLAGNRFPLFKIPCVQWTVPALDG